jgi:hypothetical protein
VVHQGNIGSTLIDGPEKRNLGPGNATVTAGCYSHSVANATAVGSAVVKSTVWYDPQP